MKQVLANITSFQIRLKYSPVSTSYTAQLDNVVLNLESSGTPPAITSFYARLRVGRNNRYYNRNKF